MMGTRGKCELRGRDLVDDVGVPHRVIVGAVLGKRACDGRACDGRVCDGRACDGRACDGRVCDGRVCVM